MGRSSARVGVNLRASGCRLRRAAENLHFVSLRYVFLFAYPATGLFVALMEIRRLFVRFRSLSLHDSLQSS